MQASRRINLLRWGMVALVAVAFAIRVSTLTTQSLWRDEVDALRFATAPWREMLDTFTRPGWNGPLYFALLRAWVAVTGTSEFALRYLSLIFGAVAVALAFALGRRWVGLTPAILCAVLFTVSPYLIWYSQEAKMYTLILAMAMLAAYALRQAIKTNRALWWAALVVATSIAFYAHILAALLIPVEMILAILWGWESRQSGWWKGALVSFACLTAPYLPLLRWQLPLVFTPAQTGYAFYPFTDMLLVMLNAFATGISGSLPAAATWPAGVLFIAGVIFGGVRWREKLIMLIWCLLPAAMLFIASLNRPIFTDRYLIWIGPAFYLLVALGGLALWRMWKPLGSLVLIAVIGLALAGTHAQLAQPIKSDFRSAAHYIEPRYTPGDLVIFQIPYVRYTFDYYYHKPYDWAEGLFTNYGMSDADVDTQMRAMTAGRKTVWLVASEMTMWDSHLQVWHWLESRARRQDAAEFAQVIVYRYEF